MTSWLVVGLGNPGSRYEGTRHNIGFDCVDRIFSRMGNGSRWQERFGAAITEASIPSLGGGSIKVIFVKPQRYMNLSGEPVREVAAYNGVEVGNIIVVHDDIDLPAGGFRLRAGGGHGGHNGLRSLIEMMGSKEFIRMKIGVGRPNFHRSGDGVQGSGIQGSGEAQNSEDRQELISRWVLGRFSREERSLVDQVIEERALEAVKTVFDEGIIAAQNRFN